LPRTDGPPLGWNGTPSAVFSDTSEVHSGHASVRIERRPGALTIRQRRRTVRGPQGAIDERQFQAKEVLATRSRLSGFPFHAQITQKRLSKLALECSIVFGQETLPQLDVAGIYDDLPQCADDHYQPKGCRGAGIRMPNLTSARNEDAD
jgi:hypothetical protein